MRNDVSLRLNDVASKLANDVVSLRTQTQKETFPKRKCFFLVRRTDLDIIFIIENSKSRKMLSFVEKVCYNGRVL